VEGVTISPDGLRAFVANVNQNSVAMIDATTSAVIKNIDLVHSPRFVAITPTGQTVYATGSLGAMGVVSVINAVTGDVLSTIEIGSGTNPQGVAVNPVSKTIYVANINNNSLSWIASGSDSVGGTIAVGRSPLGVAVSKDGKFAYVTNYDSASVSVIDTISKEVIGTIQVGVNPNGVAVAPDGGHVYVANSKSNSVSVINTTTNAVTQTIQLNCPASGCSFLESPVTTGPTPYGVAVSPDGSQIYVTEWTGNSVATIGVVSNGLIGDGGGIYRVTMSGGGAGSCAASARYECGVAGNETFLLDPPGTSFTVPESQAQQQSDLLVSTVYDDLSNATWVTNSAPTVGYTNPLIPDGYQPYFNGTESPATQTFTTTLTTSKTDSTQWSVSVKASLKPEFGGPVAFLKALGISAEASASQQYTIAKTETQTYTDTKTATVLPNNTLFFYYATPVQRFFGNWTVQYGNTTYNFANVWYDTPFPSSGQVTTYVGAFTCEAGSEKCAQLQAGNFSNITTGFPTGYPTYAVAQSTAQSSYNYASA
jgi:YVTN family beta-propeller protein